MRGPSGDGVGRVIGRGDGGGGGASQRVASGSGGSTGGGSGVAESATTTTTASSDRDVLAYAETLFSDSSSERAIVLHQTLREKFPSLRSRKHGWLKRVLQTEEARSRGFVIQTTTHTHGDPAIHLSSHSRYMVVFEFPSDEQILDVVERIVTRKGVCDTGAMGAAMIGAYPTFKASSGWLGDILRSPAATARGLVMDRNYVCRAGTVTDLSDEQLLDIIDRLVVENNEFKQVAVTRHMKCNHPTFKRPHGWLREVPPR